MAIFYGPAAGLIAFFSKVPVTFRQIVTGAYDPTTGQPAQTITDYAVLGFRYPNVDQFRFGTVSMTAVQVMISKLSLDAVGFTGDPKPGSELVIDGTVYKIQQVAQISDGSTATYYDVVTE